MQKTELEKLESFVALLEKIDIANKIEEEIKTSGGVLETTFIGEIPAFDFIDLFEMAMNGFKNLLNSNIKWAIPSVFYVPGSQDNILSQASMLRSRIDDNNFVSAATHLSICIVYLRQYNFISEIKNLTDDDRKIARLNEIYTDTERKYKSLIKIIEEKDKLIADIEKIKTDNQLTNNQRASDFLKIAKELNQASIDSKSINELLIQSTSNEQKILNYVENFNHEYVKLEKLLADKQREIARIEKAFSENFEKSQSYIEGTFSYYEDITKRSKDFDEQLAKLNDLLGKQAASSLFSTFKARKEELSKPVTRWICITFGMGVFALIWVSAVFTNFFGWVEGTIAISTEYLILNTLKSVPVIILLYFSIRQYVRERNMQEEYAFRSAIALTIQAYGDMVGDKKHELIMAATSTIYTMPTNMKEKSFSFFRKRDNGLIEIMKQLNETLKNVKS